MDVVRSARDTYCGRRGVSLNMLTDDGGLIIIILFSDDNVRSNTV